MNKTNILNYLLENKIAYITEDEVVKATLDDSFISLLSFLKEKSFLEKQKITKIESNGSKTAHLGFSEVNQKWYCWNQRVNVGIKVGMEMKPGLVGFQPSNSIEFKEKWRSWYSDIAYGKLISIDYYSSKNKKVNNSFHCNKNNCNDDGLLVVLENEGNTEEIFIPYPDKFGKGSWTALTLEDCKQMAIDIYEATA